MKDFWKRKRNKRIAASALAVVMAGFLVWGLFPWQAAAAKTTVADNVTINNWHDSEALDDSTKNVGRIWTDKSVSTEDVTLTNKSGDTKTIKKGQKSYDDKTDSDFLVGLSALSSTAKIMGQTTVPLDIVLVLDVSGSMDDYSGGYQEVYQLDTNKTYYIYSYGRYREVKYDNKSQRWYYQNYGRRHYVLPKTSAEDSDRNHMQFYSDGRVKKIDTLKKAVNGFIEQTALENDKRSDVNKQSRISLVKFAGEKTKEVGNDTYKDGGYTYNYTQIVKEYDTYTKTNMSELQSLVNKLEPAGATSADYGMAHAQALVNQSKADETANTDRKNVKRIVIFFTDGQPNHGSGFNETVANSAITTAKVIKTDADIYTIGVFDSANASDTTGHFNAYMHGMSSNYPKATTYENLGERAKDSQGNNTQFYKAATDASKLNDIFTEIQEEIVTSAQSPTHVDQGEKPNQGGYITFTDQLGDYMQVDDINTLVYAKEEFKYSSKNEENTNGKKTLQYIFNQVIPETNHVYPEGNLKDIIIIVEKSNNLQTGDLVTVKIPANLIPLRFYQVTADGKMTIDETYPMRLFYDVSLKDGVADKIENPDDALQEYIKANKDDEGQVHFYTNKYDKESKDENSNGIGAYAHFVPATTNDFYYFQNDEVLYLDKNCTKPAKDAIDESGNTIYYYQRDYYELGDDGKAESKINTVEIPGNSNLLLSNYATRNSAGQYYIPAGTPRTTSLSYFTENKAEGANKTNTATTSIKPVWKENFAGNSITTYLGNNGRMTFDLPGELDITKTVNAAEGHTVPDSLEDKEFEYTLALTAKDGSTLKDEYTAQKYNGPEADGDAFKIKPGGTFTLKDGQTLKIYGLAAGTEYMVTETKADHFTASVAQDNAGDNANTGTNNNDGVFANGTITGHDTTVVNYTNTYKAAPGTLNGSTNLQVKKDFVLANGDSAWDMDYLKNSQFTFYLTADTPNAPMPEGTTEAAPGIKAARITVSSENDIEQAFGNIEFTKPGTYEYRIVEQNPGEAGKLGVSYSYATYTVTVNVTDQNGRLETNAVMKKVRNDDGAELKNDNTVNSKTAVFKNVYDADSQTVLVQARKVFTDYTGNRTLKDGEYTFRITPQTPNAPMPEGSSKYIETKNTDIGVRFPEITFTAKDAAGAPKEQPKEYEYLMEEVIPNDADNNHTKDGITYDPTKYTIKLKVYIDTLEGKDVVVAAIEYFNEDGTTPITTVPVFHNSYRAESVTLSDETNTALKGAKILSGRDMKDGERFDFTLTAGDESTGEAINAGTVAIAENGDRASVSSENKSFNFGDVTFTKEGTYTFDIKETVPNPKAGGMTYDQHTTKATVVVTDDTDHPGKLKASVTYNNGTVSDETDKAVFENKYEASHVYSTSGGLNVEKVLNGRTMKAGEFHFTITADGSTDAEKEAAEAKLQDHDKSFANDNQRASGEPDSMQKLQGLVFTEADAGKTYTYTVAETAGDLSGVTYDGTEYTVAIEVVDNGDGTMHTVTTIRWKDADGIDQEAVYDSSDADAGIPTVRFDNSYKAADANPVDITEGFNKVLTGREWKDSDSFTFTIANTEKPESVEAAPMPMKDGELVTEVAVKSADVQDGKAPISFGNITFKKAGVYKYEVKENVPQDKAAGMVYDDTARTITVTVTDNEKGQLVAAVTTVEGRRTFTNKYETADLPLDEVCGVSVIKVLYGHDMAKDQFEFTIKAADKPSADKLKIATEDGATFKNPAAAADGKIATLFSGLGMTLTQSDIGKTYSYTFAETKGNAAGYKYDENTYKLDITTHDAGDGTLTATVVLTNTKTNKELFRETVSEKDKALGENGVVIPFENRYDGSTDVDGGTKADVKADKTLTGRSLKADEFTFMLATKPADGSEGEVLQTKTNSANGTIPFEALSYRTSGKVGSGTILKDAVEAGYATKNTNDKGETVYTLNYQVYEDTESLPANGVSATTSTFAFNVIVTDKGDGTLTAETQYPQGKNKFEFINTYSTGEPIPMDIEGSKTLDYAEGLTPNDIAGKFTFTLEAMTPGAPMPDNTTAKNDAAGNVDFGKTTFKLSDLEDVTPAADGSRSKTFEYKVTESGSAAGVTNDTNKTKPFQITLKDDGKGKLTATCNPKEGPKFTFTNTYSVGELPSSITDQIKIDKNLTGRDLKKGEFSFELLENGKVVAKGTNDASGNVTFDKITYNKPGTHTYTVREVNNDLGGVTYDDQLYTVHTTITDNGDGTLSAEHQVIAPITDNGEAVPAEKNAITFSNKYKAAPTSVTVGAVKKLEGKDLKDGQFTFQLKDETGKVIDEAKNDKAGAISFKALEFDKAGTYKYTISEVNDKQKEIKYDTSEKTVTITVKDSGDGYLQAQVESEKQLIFTNSFEAAGGSGTKTGDNMNLVLPIMMMLTAAAIGSVLLIRRKYHR